MEEGTCQFVDLHKCTFMCICLFAVFPDEVYLPTVMHSLSHLPLLVFSFAMRFTRLCILGAIVYAIANTAAISYSGSFAQCWHVLDVRESGVSVH